MGNTHVVAVTEEYKSDGPVARRIAATIPYYPFKGIDKFYDVGGLVANPEAFNLCIDVLTTRYSGLNIDSIGGLDARGFLFGPPVALRLGKPFFMLRKKGKMPNCIGGHSYTKEYKGDEDAGDDQIFIPKGAVKPGDRVLLIDDLIATGGTMLAAADLVTHMGGVVVEAAAVVEIKFLKGTERLIAAHPETHVWSLISEDILTLNGEAET